MECEPAQVRLWGPSTFSSWAWQVHKDSNTMAIPLLPAQKNSDRSRHLNIAGGSTHHPPPREPESREVNLLFLVQVSCPRAFQHVGVIHPPGPQPSRSCMHSLDSLSFRG